MAVGEVLRRMIAKLLIGETQLKAQEVFQEVRQLGVGTRGGAEITVQRTDVVEKERQARVGSTKSGL